MALQTPNPKFDHVYAIVRVDDLRTDAPASNRVTVKKIVWSEEEALAEVARLNQLNAEKGCEYFYQVTRLAKQDTAPAAAAAEAAARARRA